MDDWKARMAAITGSKRTPTPSTESVSPDDATVERLLDELDSPLRTNESNNRKTVKNSRTGAAGFYQVLPENIPKWTAKHLKRRMSEAEFLADEDAQRRVFRGEFGSYLREGLKRSKGDEETAIRRAGAAWYGGPGRMEAFNNSKRFRPNEPSYKEYGDKFVNLWRQSKTSESTAPSTIADLRSRMSKITGNTTDQPSIDVTDLRSRMSAITRNTAEQPQTPAPQIQGKMMNGVEVIDQPKDDPQTVAPVRPPPTSTFDQNAQLAAFEQYMRNPQNPPLTFEQFNARNATQQTPVVPQTPQTPVVQTPAVQTPQQTPATTPTDEMSPFAANSANLALAKMKLPKEMRIQFENEVRDGVRPNTAESFNEFVTLQNENAQKVAAELQPKRTRGRKPIVPTISTVAQPEKAQEEVSFRARPNDPIEWSVNYADKPEKMGLREWLDEQAVARMSGIVPGATEADIRQVLKQDTPWTDADGTPVPLAMTGKLSGAGRVTITAGLINLLDALVKRRTDKDSRKEQYLAQGLSDSEAELEAMLQSGTISPEQYNTTLYEAKLAEEKENEARAQFRNEFSLGFFQNLSPKEMREGNVSPDDMEAFRASEADKVIGEKVKQFGSMTEFMKQRARVQEEYKYRYMAAPSEFALNFIRQIANVPAQIGQAASILANEFNVGALGDFEGDASKSPFYQFWTGWEDRINSSKNTDIQSGVWSSGTEALLANEVADGLSQFATQAILFPVTGGASLALPLIQAGTAQYKEASKGGATRIERMLATTVGGLAAIPDALLQAKWLRPLMSGGTIAKFIDALSAKLFTNLSKQLPEAEARIATKNFVLAFISNTPVGFVSEYGQERLEDVTNKATAKLTYNPNITWEDVFIPNDAETRGYIAAGIAGAFGGNIELVVSKMSDADLLNADGVLGQAMKKGPLSAEDARLVAIAVQKEAENRKLEIKKRETIDGLLRQLNIGTQVTVEGRAGKVKSFDGNAVQVKFENGQARVFEPAKVVPSYEQKLATNEAVTVEGKPGTVVATFADGSVSVEFNDGTAGIVRGYQVEKAAPQATERPDSDFGKQRDAIINEDGQIDLKTRENIAVPQPADDLGATLAEAEQFLGSPVKLPKGGIPTDLSRVRVSGLDAVPKEGAQTIAPATKAAKQPKATPQTVTETATKPTLASVSPDWRNKVNTDNWREYADALSADDTMLDRHDIFREVLRRSATPDQDASDILDRIENEAKNRFGNAVGVAMDIATSPRFAQVIRDRALALTHPLTQKQSAALDRERNERSLAEAQAEEQALLKQKGKGIKQALINNRRWQEQLSKSLELSEPTKQPKATPKQTETVRETPVSDKTQTEKEVGQKETWEMTKNEFRENAPRLVRARQTLDELRNATGERWGDARRFMGKAAESRLDKIARAEQSKNRIWDQTEQQHYKAVERALKQGKAVRAEVLADYPDLAKKYAQKPPVTESEAASKEVKTPVVKGEDAVVGKGKDGKTKEDAQTIVDVGEKIGGARKDWRLTGLTADDLAGMSQGEESKYITKANIWKPDYAAITDANGAKVAAMIKVLWDGLAVKPRVDTQEQRHLYLDVMSRVRNVLQNTSSETDVKTALEQVQSQLSDPRHIFTLARNRTNPLRTQFGLSRKADKLVAQGFPSIEPWQRRFTVRKYNNEWVVVNRSSRVVERADTEADAIVKAQELYNTATAKDAVPKRPHLDRIERKGKDYRNGKNVTGDDFLTDFGFRGIEFGNWAASDERQRLVNYGYDALQDLANILGISPRALSLNGTLGLAFGARGGGSAAAHYEPAKLVINLTKINGAGALAHEWGHALDHYFGELNEARAYSGSPRSVSGWRDISQLQRRSLSNLRPEMQSAFRDVLSALFETERTKAEAVRDVELRLERLQAAIDRQQSESKILRERIGDAKPDQYQRKFLKESATWVSNAKIGLESTQRKLVALKGETAPQDGGYGKVESSYYKNAQQLSGKQGKRGYWARPTELFARAFESYVFDKIRQQGDDSNYLVQGVEGDRYASATYAGNPYPVGVERATLNAAFDKVFDTIEEETTDDGNVILKSVSSIEEWDSPAYERELDSIKLTRDKDGKILAPNGKVSNIQNERLAKVIRSKAFLKWFEGSQVVDENGEPMITAHGTSAPIDFAAFRIRDNDVGIHFGTFGQANDRLEFLSRYDSAPNQRILPIFLTLKNPLRLKDAGWWDWNNVPDTLQRTGLFTDREIRTLETFERDSQSYQPSYDPYDEGGDEDYSYEELPEYKELQREFRQAVHRLLADYGYDGIVYKNEGETQGGAELQRRADELQELVNRKYGTTNAYSPEVRQTPEYQAFRDAYDAAEHHRKNNGEDSYIAFEPNQIKSVFNRGSFAPDDNSILKSVSSEPSWEKKPNGEMSDPILSIKEWDSAAFEKELAGIELKHNAEGQILAPNGKVSNIQNERLAKVIRSKAFLRWFGDSQVKDENGEPLPVFHGTKSDTDILKPTKSYEQSLIFLTQDPTFASTWARFNAEPRHRNFTQVDADRMEESYRAWLDKNNPLFNELVEKKDWDAYDEIRRTDPRRLQNNGEDWDSNVMPLFVSAQKLFDPRADYALVEPLIARTPRMSGLIERGAHKAGNWIIYESEEVKAFIRSKGYDGIRLTENADYTGDQPHDTIAVFESNQIKSVFNRGSFSPEDNSILRKQRDAQSTNLLNSYLPYEERTYNVVENVESGFNANGELEVNEYGSEVIRRALAQINRNPDETEFNGLALSAGNLINIARKLKSALPGFERENYDTKPFTELIKNLEQLARSDFGIVYVYDDVLPHERVHIEDFRLGRTDARTALMASPVWAKTRKEGKFQTDYGKQTESDQISELAAILATGDGARYGLTNTAENEAFLREWARGVLNRHKAKIEEVGYEQFVRNFPTVGKYGKDTTDNSGRQEDTGVADNADERGAADGTPPIRQGQDQAQADNGVQAGSEAEGRKGAKPESDRRLSADEITNRIGKAAQTALLTEYKNKEAELLAKLQEQFPDAPQFAVLKSVSSNVRALILGTVVGSSVFTPSDVAMRQVLSVNQDVMITERRRDALALTYKQIEENREVDELDPYEVDANDGIYASKEWHLDRKTSISLSELYDAIESDQPIFIRSKADNRVIYTNIAGLDTVYDSPNTIGVNTGGEIHLLLPFIGENTSETLRHEVNHDFPIPRAVERGIIGRIPESVAKELRDDLGYPDDQIADEIIARAGANFKKQIAPIEDWRTAFDIVIEEFQKAGYKDADLIRRLKGDYTLRQLLSIGHKTEVLKSVSSAPLTNEQMELLSEYAAGQILQNVPYKNLTDALSSMTGADIGQINDVYAMAVEAINKKAQRRLNTEKQQGAKPESDRRLSADAKIKHRQFAVSMAEQLFDIGTVEYMPETEAGWSEKALNTVEELGSEKAIDKYRAMPANDSTGNKTALGIGIAIDLYQKGDFTQLEEFGVELTKNIGNVAQELRAAALLSRLSPVFAATYAERATQRGLGRAATTEEKATARVLAERLADLADQVTMTKAALDEQIEWGKSLEEKANEIEELLKAEKAKNEAVTKENLDLRQAVAAAKEMTDKADTERRTPRQIRKLRKEIIDETPHLIDVIKKSLPSFVLKSVASVSEKPLNADRKSISSIEDWDSAAFEKELDSIELKRNAEGQILAPNGKVSNIQNERLAKVIRSKAFLKWFGNWINDPKNASKVVDFNGEPRQVFHSSDAPDIEVFEPNWSEGFGTGVYFSELANPGEWFGDITYPVFLNIRRPILNNRPPAFETLENTKAFRERKYSEMDAEDSWFEDVTFANSAARELGYDGAMGENGNVDGWEYVAFQPNQIKSVFNRGSFAPEDNSILKSVSSSLNPELADAYTKLSARKMIDEFSKPLVDDNGRQIAQPFAVQQFDAWLNDLAQGTLNESERALIHAQAYEMLRPERTVMGIEPVLKTRNRAEHAMAAQLVLPNTQKEALKNRDAYRNDKFARAMVEIAQAMDATPEATYLAFGIRERPNKRVLASEFKQAFPDADFGKSLLAGERILAETKRRLEKMQMEIKHGRKLNDDDIDRIKQADRLRRGEAMNARRELERYYLELEKGTAQKVVERMLEIPGIFKSLMSTGEISAVFRQGMIPFLAFSSEWGTGTKGVVAGFKSDENRIIFEQEMRDDPYFQMAEHYGVIFNQIGSKGQVDEHFPAAVFENLGKMSITTKTDGTERNKLVAGALAVPIGGAKLQQKFEHAYTLPLDVMRLGLFKNLAKVAEEADMKPRDLEKAYRYAAYIANISVGKGSIEKLFGRGNLFRKAIDSFGLFSASLLLSRIEAGFAYSPAGLAVAYHYGGKGMAVHMAKKSARIYAALAPTAMLLQALVSALLGWDDDDEPWSAILDPSSRYFMKLRLPNKQNIDLTANLTDWGKLFFPNFMASGYHLTQGAVGNDKAGYAKAADVWREDANRLFGNQGRYWRGKLSPAPSAIADVWTGSTYIGRPWTTWGLIASRTSPITYQQIWDAAVYDPADSLMKEPETAARAWERVGNLSKENAFNASLLAALSSVGFNVTQYERFDMTPAEEKAMDIYHDNGGFPSKKTAEERRVNTGLRNLFRYRDEMVADKKDPKPIDRAISVYAAKYNVGKGRLTDVREQSKVNTLDFATKSMTSAQIKSLIDYARGQEIDQLTVIYNKKVMSEAKKKVKEAKRDR